jgi:hypothetical protein
MEPDARGAHSASRRQLPSRAFSLQLMATLRDRGIPSIRSPAQLETDLPKVRFLSKRRWPNHDFA